MALIFHIASTTNTNTFSPREKTEISSHLSEFPLPTTYYRDWLGSLELNAEFIYLFASVATALAR